MPQVSSVINNLLQELFCNKTSIKCYKTVTSNTHKYQYSFASSHKNPQGIKTATYLKLQLSNDKIDQF